MVSAEDRPLEMSPEALNGIGSHITDGILAHPVTDNIVDVSFLRKTLVGRKFIGKYRRIISNELLDDGHKGNGLGVLHLQRTDTALTGHHTEDWGLGLGGASLRVLRFLGFVFVGLTATKVHFIHFHLAVKDRGIILGIEGTDLMENEPSGLLRDTNITAQLHRGNALLVAADEIHRNEPLAEGNLGVLKDGSDKDGEIRLAMGAMEATIGTGGAMVLTAERANHIGLLPTGLKDSLAAFGFRIKVIGKVKDVVEAAEVNHKSQV